MPNRCRSVLSLCLLLASNSFAEDYAIGFKGLIIRPIYDPAAKCQPLGGYGFYVPATRPDGSFDPANAVVVMTESIRAQVIKWYGMFFGPENVGAKAWDAFAPLCVGLYDDVVQSGAKKGEPDPNAFATDRRHILVGKHMLARVAKGVFGGQQETALLFILAHEFGHHVQYQFAQTYSEPTARTSELQADCLAGYILASSDQTAFSPVVYRSVHEQAGKLGDFDVLNPDHHGTPAERSKAFQLGWTMGGAGRVVDFMNNKKDTMPHKGAAAALRACSNYPSDQQKAEKAPKTK